MRKNGRIVNTDAHPDVRRARIARNRITTVIHCPSVEQIREAASKNSIVNDALRELFPEAFEIHITYGEVYSWDFGNMYGLLVQSASPRFLYFVGDPSGKFITKVPTRITKEEFTQRLNNVPGSRLGNCYAGEISGPTGR